MSKFASVKAILDNQEKWDIDRERQDRELIAALRATLKEIKDLTVGETGAVMRLIAKLCEAAADLEA